MGGADDQVRISQNSIYSNAPRNPIYGLGIDLGGDDVTPNDPGDADNGPNDLQNFPVLASAENVGGNTVIKGTLSSTPNTSFRIEFFSSPEADASGHGEGRSYLLPPSADVTTDGAGNATITYTTEEALPIGHVVAATATPKDVVAGSSATSEFSKVITVSGPPNTTITSGPSGTVKSDSATFEFVSSEPGSTFRCRLDGAATFGPCSSPKSYANLSDGNHTFRVRAVDSGGNLDPTAEVRTWTVDTTAPSITSPEPTPGSATTDRTPRIGATVLDGRPDLKKSHIKLYLDGEMIPRKAFSYNRETDRLYYTSAKLSLGSHAARIVAKDAAGNVGVRIWGFKVIG